MLATWRPLGGDIAALGVSPTTAPATATSTPPATFTATPSGTPTSIVRSSRTPTRARVTPDSEADLQTQTAIPAQQTLAAIAARARATAPATPGPSPTPRQIDTTTNFLLLGSDMRPSDPSWTPATDVMMVLFLDRAANRAALLSLPRDLVVAIPGHNAFRINYAFQYGLRKGGVPGGVSVVKQVLHNEFGIRIDHWALIDFNGFQKIIDTLGGIDVTVACPLEDTIDEQHFVIPAGQVHMDYATAKRFVQSRYSTSDTSRNFRQQRVLWAILKKGMQASSPELLPTLWGQVSGSVQTDMSLLDMLALAPVAYQLDPLNHPERIHARVLEYPAVYPYVAADGAWLFMPDYDAIEGRLDQLFKSPAISPSRPDAAECPAVQPTGAPAPADTPAAVP